MRTLLLSSMILSAALVGCDDGGGDDTADLTFLDKDNDGFSIDDGDCNDQDPLVHPDASELCNGRDDNCNTAIDEDGALDAQVWFVDFDRDGFGIPPQEGQGLVRACAQPEGYVNNQIDCDDTNRDANPEQIEMCDGIDNDCDGNTDEGTAEDALIYLQDADGDGFGSIYTQFRACSQPSGYVDPAPDLTNDPEAHDDPANWTVDCNDTRIDINPAGTEVCDPDGFDEDCDGLINEEDPSLSNANEFWPDRDGDGYGQRYEDVGGLPVCELDDPGNVLLEPIELCADFVAGFIGNNDDCCDGNRFVNPDYKEVCGNELDDDCDGTVDNGTDTVTWYADDDTDNYGSPDKPTIDACARPSGYVSNDEDCNDDDPNIRPDAIEIWYDGIDRDCAGDSDFDADGDGYESAAYAGEDCDDSSDEVNPGLPEIIEDGRDNNCDTVTDPASVEGTWYGEEESQRMGDSVDFVRNFDNDSDDEIDLIFGASRYDGLPPGNANGAVYVTGWDLAGGVSSIAATYVTKLEGANQQDYLGISVAGLDNQDGDASNISDLAAGAYGYDGPTAGALESGAVYIVNGPLNGDYDVDTVYDALYYGESAFDWAGYSIDEAGDVNEDGYSDLIVGAYLHDPNGTGGTVRNAGAAYLLLGPLSTSTPLNLSFADQKLSGTEPGEWAGYSVAGGGDHDGDGATDMLVSAPQMDVGGSAVGGFYLVEYDGTASIALGTAEGIRYGESTASFAGWSVAFAGDVNGDGRDDVIVGAPEQTSAGPQSGTVYVIHGPVTSTKSLATAEAIIEAENNDDYLGSAVAGAGDVDNDGRDDLLIGASQDDFGASNGGAVYVVPSPILGTESIAENGVKLAGQENGDRLGTRIAGGSYNLDEEEFMGFDVNDDDYADVLGGAPYDDTNVDDGGAVFLIFGSTDL
ncbi:MAG: MopE-related protein [Myxococcota bacterium]